MNNMSFLGMFFGSKVGASFSDNIRVLSAKDFRKEINKGTTQLVDVRTAREYNSEHIENASNVDYFSPDFIKKMQFLKKDKPVFIYCRSGNRSKQAARKLVADGFIEVIDLKGGFIRWK